MVLARGHCFLRSGAGSWSCPRSEALPRTHCTFGPCLRRTEPSTPARQHAHPGRRPRAKQPGCPQMPAAGPGTAQRGENLLRGLDIVGGKMLEEDGPAGIAAN